MLSAGHGMGEGSLAARIAAFAGGIARRDLPEAVAARAAACVHDHCHAVLAGGGTSVHDCLRAYLRGGLLDGNGRALALGAMSAAVEIDDVHLDTWIHTGSVVVSAVLAAARDGEVSRRRLLCAVVAGYEVGVRLAIAAGEAHYSRHHTTGTCGTIAAAVASGVVLGLSGPEMDSAVGIAATSASGLWEGLNLDAVALKHFHSGFAAQKGLAAAKLARAGLTASAGSLDGPRGFLRTMTGGGEADPRAGWIPLPGDDGGWTITRGVFKRYPFCLGCFEPLEGVRDIMRSGPVERERAARIELELHPGSYRLVGNASPRDGSEAKFSAPYAVSAALAGFDVEDVDAATSHAGAPDVAAWCALVSCRPNPDVPRRHAWVRLVMKDGTVRRADRPLRSLDEAEASGRYASRFRGTLRAEPVDFSARNEPPEAEAFSPSVHRLVDRLLGFVARGEGIPERADS